MPRATAYGPHQARLFRRLDRLRILDATGFAEELSFRAGREIDPSNVSHWKSGNSHFPMDALPALAEFIDDGGAHDGVDLVFGSMLRDLGYRAVRAPVAAKKCDPLVAVHRVLSEASDVMSCLIASLDPDGPEGERMDREEAARTKQEIAELRRAIDALDEHCDDVLGAAPVRRIG